MTEYVKLIAQGVCKKIHGKMILDHLNLELTGGKIYGFTGRNGSGKTMVFRALSGLMRIDAGLVTFNGGKLHEDFSVLPGLGIVLENAGLYPNLTGMQNLAYLAGFRKLIGCEDIRQALLRVGLDPDDNRSYRKYSLGMKQRLAIAQAIMEKPDVIMLDEPTNGLDEEGVGDIRQLILEEKTRGALILVASHNKDDIRLLADQIYRVENGHVFALEGGTH